MEVVSIERSTYEELLMSFNSFVTKMKEMASISNDKRLGEWLDNQDVCQMLNISPRTLQTLRDNRTLAYSQINHKVYYKPEDVERILHVVAGTEAAPQKRLLWILFLRSWSSHHEQLLSE
ncbi:MAG: helix-turn-helix domain-containing protein [Prevotella sp.]|nr:helix-turn-helix domain-containing protein [Prevotella sp.]